MEFLETLLNEYGIWAMLLFIFLEYACFPVSSEIVLPLSGALAAAKGYPFLLVVPLSVAAGLLGTYLCYGLGRLGGDSLLKYICKRFPSMEAGIQRSEKYFDRYGSFTVALLRIVPLCRTYVAFVAGALKMPTATYLSSSLLGITLWNTLLIGAGYELGKHWDMVQNWYASYKGILLPVVTLIILTIISLHISKHSKS